MSWREGVPITSRHVPWIKRPARPCLTLKRTRSTKIPYTVPRPAIWRPWVWTVVGTDIGGKRKELLPGLLGKEQKKKKNIGLSQLNTQSLPHTYVHTYLIKLMDLQGFQNLLGASDSGKNIEHREYLGTCANSVRGTVTASLSFLFFSLLSYIQYIPWYIRSICMRITDILHVILDEY